MQQPATAQGVQAAPGRAPLEGGVCGLHGLVHVGLSGQKPERVVTFCHVLGELSRQLQRTAETRVRHAAGERGLVGVSRKVAPRFEIAGHPRLGLSSDFFLLYVLGLFQDFYNGQA